MLQETPVIPHTWAQWLWTFLVASLGYAASLLTEWFKKRRSPAEEAKTNAETRSINTATDLSLVNAACEVLAKAGQVIDKCNHWQRKAEELERRLVQAEADSAAAQLFTEQLKAAGKLLVCEHHPDGVKLSDYTPQQLNRPKHT